MEMQELSCVSICFKKHEKNTLKMFFSIFFGKIIDICYFCIGITIRKKLFFYE